MKTSCAGSPLIRCNGGSVTSRFSPCGGQKTRGRRLQRDKVTERGRRARWAIDCWEEESVARGTMVRFRGREWREDQQRRSRDRGTVRARGQADGVFSRGGREAIVGRSMKCADSDWGDGDGVRIAIALWCELVVEEVFGVGAAAVVAAAGSGVSVSKCVCVCLCLCLCVFVWVRVSRRKRQSSNSSSRSRSG
jgi:hypothetical protein